MTDRMTIDGRGIHVADCYVWAEIFYLDSITDYREWIPKHVSQQRTATGEEFVTLDKKAKFLGVLLALGRSISHRLNPKEWL